jgi:hypothetical protein
VDDFALQSIPDSSIIAGDRDTLTSVPAVPLINQISIAQMGRRVIIDNSFPGTSAMTVQIIDVAGQVRYNRNSNQRQLRIELPEWPAGIYFVSVTSNQARATKKISIR